MKKMEDLGKKLSIQDQKAIMGGQVDPPGCLSIGEACNSDVQCCSNYCESCPPGSCPTTGKMCHPA